jgi:hypothetical protein
VYVPPGASVSMGGSQGTVDMLYGGFHYQLGSGVRGVGWYRAS